MAALDSLDSLTDADREHLAPFLHAGPTTARSTALQYVKSDPVSKREPQGRRILVAAVCAKNPDGGSARELPPCRDPARTHGNTLLGCLLCALDDIMGQQSDYSTIANAPEPHVRTAAIEYLKGRVAASSAGGSGGGGEGGQGGGGGAGAGGSTAAPHPGEQEADGCGSTRPPPAPLALHPLRSPSTHCARPPPLTPLALVAGM